MQQDTLLQVKPISDDHDSMQGEPWLALMCHLVHVLQQSEVCGEEDVCSAFGHQIAGMVSGVPIHLSVKQTVRFYLSLSAVKASVSTVRLQGQG